MEDQEVEKLLERYISGTATDNEIAYVETWYLKAPIPEAKIADTQIIEDQRESLDKIIQQIPSRKHKLWPTIAAVAAVAVIIFSAGLFYSNNNHKKDLTVTLNKIVPGSIGATLTLSNGKKVTLNALPSGEVANQLGLSINKTADGQLVYEKSGIKNSTEADGTTNTLSTDNGQTYMIVLPDKSKVWLNAASSLTYSLTLNDNGFRKVKLNGEAYFEIAKDKNHPFIVSTENQEIKVLGTHFNVNSYKDEEAIKTTLLEGSVQVSIPKSNITDILKPGQQSVLQNNSLRVVAAKTDEAIAWKNGYFQFNESHLRSIMREISRWYDIDIVYEGKVEDALFYVKIPRNLSLTEVMKILEINGINFKIEGRKLIVKS